MLNIAKAGILINSILLVPIILRFPVRVAGAVGGLKEWEISVLN
jgi:hypothetical protein